MDSLAYTYFNSAADYYNGQPINRLSSVTDNAGATAYELDFEGTSNYEYDAIGNLISDSRDSIATIEWNTYGKVRKVTRAAQSTKPDLEFWYDPMGNRLCKIVKPRDGNGATNQNFWTFTWYIRDAQGNIMATYNETHFADNDDYYACLTASEMPMYGSSRLGVQKVYDTLSVIQYVNQTFDADSFYTSVYENIPITLPDANHVAYNPLYKQYEFSNHLNNVLLTLSARPRLIYDQNDNFLYKEADVTSISDYYPFGMLAPERHWQSDSYRFGFNGKENLNEISGWQDYGERMYNRLIGRFPTADPLIVKRQQYPELSPYQFASNRPIDGIDLDGLEYYFFGNKKYAEYVGNTSINKAWEGFVVKNIYQVRNNMQQLSNLSYDKSPKVIFVQHHSNENYMSLATGGEDTENANWYDMAGKFEGFQMTDFTSKDINSYLNKDESLAPEKYDAINALSQTLNYLPEGGVAIFGGCLQGNEDLPSAVSKLAPGRLILMNKDFQSGFVMDEPINPPKYISEEYGEVGFKKGWVGALNGKKHDVSNLIGALNIKLNSDGKPPVQIIKQKK